MAVVNPPAFLQNAGATHTAEITRNAMGLHGAGRLSASSLKQRGGVLFELGGALRVQQAGSPNMTVDVLAGAAYIPGTQGSKQGMYHVMNDATVNLAIAAADGSLNRIDLVVYRVRDSLYSGADNDSGLVVVTGTPASSPSPPAAPANSITLAQVSIPATDTTISDAQITDLRPFYAANGGVIRCSSTTRPASTFIMEGQLIYETDTDLFRYFDGTNWLLARPWTRTTTLGANAASITISSIPTTLKFIKCLWTVKSSQASTAQNVRMRVNGDSGANYNYQYLQVTSTGGQFFLNPAFTYAHVGVCGAANSAANNFGAGEVTIAGWNRSPNLNGTFHSHFWESDTSSWYHAGGFLHFAAGSNTSVQIFADLGNLITGSQLTVSGEE